MAVRPRIAVTGIGLVSALGAGHREVFRRVCAGERGLRPLRLFDTAGQRSRIAGEVSELDVRAVLGDDWSEEASRSDALAMLAAREALAGSERGDAGELAVVVGGTTGGMFETELGLVGLPQGPLPAERVRRLLQFPVSVSAERIASAVGAGLCATLSSACASSALALILAASWLLSGRAQRVLAGGVDGLCQLTFNGFNALGAADPEPCRPFDVTRAGLNLGEGAAFLLLEREPDAQRRAAHVFGFLSGWATGSEAHHVTQPDPAAERASQLIAEALRCAALSPQQIDYVNAHGTGTLQNDAMEALALKRALGGECERIWVSSSKAQLGHTLGAAGAIEAALTVLALEAGMVLPAVGLETPATPGLRFAGPRAVASPLRAALSSSFGFGGSCAVLAFEAPDAPERARSLMAVPEPVVSLAAWRSSAPTKAFAEEPVSELAVERSRRFGRASALACCGIDALHAADGALSNAGLTLSNAFGDVERSVRFIRRVFDAGAKAASPAEFPQLLASSAVGNASLYARLHGPCLTVSDGQTGGELALSTALAWLDLDPSRPYLAGGFEAFDPIVDELLAAESPAARAEGGGLVLIETEAHARAGGRRPLARIVEHRLARDGMLALLASLSAPGQPARAQVLCVAPEPPLLRALAASAWAEVGIADLALKYGFNEAIGALALAVAARQIGAGELDEALLVRQRGTVFFMTRLARADSAPVRGAE